MFSIVAYHSLDSLKFDNLSLLFAETCIIYYQHLSFKI